METVRRISPQVRSAAKYDVSLSVLRRIAERGVVAKTGIMVGLGETEDEVLELMDDVLLAGVSVLTIGQYLQPSRKNIPETFTVIDNLSNLNALNIIDNKPLAKVLRK